MANGHGGARPGAGRPFGLVKFDAVAYVRDDGTPVTVSEHIVDRVSKLWLPWADIAAEAGVSRQTIHNWKLAGARARAKIAMGNDVTEDETKLAGFLTNIENAELEAEQVRLGVIIRESEGGYPITKTVTKTNAKGEVVERVETVETARAIWTAAAWILERKHPDRYARPDRVELTGAGGRPVEIATNGDRASALGEALDQYKAGAAMGAAVARGEMADNTPE